MTSGSVACREDFAWDDKGGAVGSAVEEELGDGVESQKLVAGEVPELEANDEEDKCQGKESKKLDRFASDSVNEPGRYPISGDGTGENENEVANGSVVKDLVHVAAA